MTLEKRSRTTGGESSDINILTRELGCVDALIDDIAAFVESHRNRDPGLRLRKLKARLDLLHWILLWSPERITALQIEQVCEYLIGSKSLGYQERDMAFSNFASLVVCCLYEVFQNHELVLLISDTRIQTLSWTTFFSTFTRL